MAFRWYAETPACRTRQIVVDVVAVIGLLLCLWIGIGVHDLTAKLAGPGRSLESAGSSLADRMGAAADAAGGVPVVGDQLSAPFNGAGDASRAIQDAGLQEQDAVAKLALALGWIAGAVPAIVALVLWLPSRIRFARLAGQGSALRDAPGGLDLLALRALASQPLSELTSLSPEVVNAWRHQDLRTIEALASLELRHLGLRSRR